VRALIGSVSTYCIHHAACPVVVVRERPDSRDGAVVGP
jgi:nucleotide-binding universal stress UspA family protein